MPITKSYTDIVPISEINVDLSYQRELNVKRAAEIAKEFDEHHANMPRLSKRKDGTYWAMDGYHTTNARSINGETTVKSIVYEGMTEKEEAEYFYKHNTSFKKPSYSEVLKSKISSGDKTAVEYDSVFKEIGLTASYRSSGDSKNAIVCHSTLMSFFKDVDRNNYKEALRIMKEAYGSDYTMYRNDLVSGVILFVDTFCNDSNYEKSFFVKRLSKSTIDEITKQTKQYIPTINSGKGKAKAKYVAMGLVDIYNKGKKNKLERTKLNERRHK